MQATWMQDAALMLFVWLIAHHYQYWGVIGATKKTQPEPPQTEKKSEKTGKEFQGLTVKPVCSLCEHTEPAAVMSRVPPPLIKPKKGRRKTVPTGLQFCPYDTCDYYGWTGMGNISSNGRPNHGLHRQLYCCACKKWFMETKGTLFYRKRHPERIVQAIATLAEGLGIRAVGRVLAVSPETVLAWLTEAVQHFEAFNTHMTCNLKVEQVQLDELYGVIRAYQAGELTEGEAIAKLERRRKPVWLWTAMDPISKFWLASQIGDRTAENAWAIVHKVVTRQSSL